MCRKLIVFVVCSILILFNFGCGSEYAAAGAGAGGGFALSETFKGAKVDLERQETILIEAWNLGVEQGADLETLAQLEEQIVNIQAAKSGVVVGESLFQVDWNDPQEVGGSVGLIVASILYYLNRKKLSRVMQGVNKFNGTHDPALAKELVSAIKSKSAELPT